MANSKMANSYYFISYTVVFELGFQFVNFTVFGVHLEDESRGNPGADLYTRT